MTQDPELTECGQSTLLIPKDVLDEMEEKGESLIAVVQMAKKLQPFDTTSYCSQVIYDKES